MVDVGVILINRVVIGGSRTRQAFPITARAPKSLRPPELLQIRPTRLLGRESALEFGQISRIILHTSPYATS